MEFCWEDATHKYTFIPATSPFNFYKFDSDAKTVAAGGFRSQQQMDQSQTYSEATFDAPEEKLKTAHCFYVSL